MISDLIPHSAAEAGEPTSRGHPRPGAEGGKPQHPNLSRQRTGSGSEAAAEFQTSMRHVAPRGGREPGRAAGAAGTAPLRGRAGGLGPPAGEQPPPGGERGASPGLAPGSVCLARECKMQVSRMPRRYLNVKTFVIA